MANQILARLGIVMGVDSGELEIGLAAAKEKFKGFTREVTRQSTEAAKMTMAMNMEMQSYGKTLTNVERVELELKSGRLAGNMVSEKQLKILRDTAAAYDAIKIAATKANATQAGGGLSNWQKQQVTYQATDTVTSLMGGQNPFMVMMQQGGQLKDQFGGLGPMFRALATYITPISVAVVGVGSALGVLALAMYKGHQEEKAFNNAMILTGGYLNMTEAGVTSLSKSIAGKYNVSIGEMRDALQAVAASGRFTTTSFNEVSNVIAKMSKLTGETAETTAKSLIPSLDGSASSAANLNSQYHFLTFAQYKHIELLEKQGKKQEAVKETAEALSTSLNKQTNEIGILESAWKGLTLTVGEFFQDLKDIGKKSTLDDQVTAAYAAVKSAEAFASREGASVVDKQALEWQKRKYEGLALQRGQEMAVKYAEATSAAKNEAEIEFDKKYGQQTLDMKANTRELDLKAEYATRMTGATKIKQLELQKELELLLAKEELRRKIAANPQMAQTLKDNSIAQEKLKVAELAKQQGDISREEILKYKEKYVLEQDSVEKERERLDVYKQNLLASDADLQIALSRLKTLQEIAEIERNTKIQDPADKVAAQDRLRSLQKSREAVINQAADLKMLQDMNHSVFNNMGSAIDNFVKTGKLSFKDLTRSIIQDLISIAMRAQMMAMFKGFNFFSGGGTVGGVTGVDNIDVGGGWSPAGTRATGGSVVGGSSYLVGENGPELFTSNTSGTITPNGQMSSSSNNQPQVVYNGPYIANMSAIDTQSATQFLAKNKQTIWAVNQSAQRSLPVSR